MKVLWTRADHNELDALQTRLKNLWADAINDDPTMGAIKTMQRLVLARKLILRMSDDAVGQDDLISNEVSSLRGQLRMQVELLEELLDRLHRNSYRKAIGQLLVSYEQMVSKLKL